MSLKNIFIGIGVTLFAIAILAPFIYRSATSGTSATSKANIPTAGVFKSSDGGETWQAKSQTDEVGAKFPIAVLSLAFTPNDPNTIFMGTKGESLWVSQNGGESWIRVIDLMGVLKLSAEIYDIAVSRLSPNTLYLAVYQEEYGRVLRSNDGGRSFEEVYKVPANRFGVFGVAVDPNDASRVYIATGQGGFFESQDAGETWKIQKWFPDGLVKIIGNPRDSSEYYVVTLHGEIYRTDNRGVSFMRLTEGYRIFPNATHITDILLDPSNPSTIYSVSQYGLLRSENRGAVWSTVPLTIPPNGISIGAVAVDDKNSREIIAGVGSEVYKSSDYGEHWRAIKLPAEGNIRFLRVPSADSNEIYTVVGR